MTSLNGIDIPPNLGLAKIVTVDFPPMPNLSSNNIIKNLLKENLQLNYDLNVLKLKMSSMKKENIRNMRTLKMQEKNLLNVISVISKPSLLST